jgi:serine protease Do
VKKWLTPVLAIVLIISLVFNGIFYFQTTSKISDIQNQLVGLQDSVSGISTIQNDVSILNSSVSNLQNDMSAVKSGLSTLQSDDVKVKEDILTLQSDISQLSSVIQSATLSFENTIKIIEPTVVRVDTDLGSGSGIIVRANGYILTNQHVIDKATSIQVTLMNGDIISAEVVVSDVDKDVAVLKLNSSRTDFPVAVIGSSSDVVVGEDVLTAGFPLGTYLTGQATFTRGIISAMRYDPDTGINYIQMDAPISLGNSGGGLFTIDGKLIGIPSYGLGDPSVDPEDLNLAIPMEVALPLIQTAAGK